MKVLTWKELEEMDVVELVKLAQSYGMTPVQIKTYSLKQIMAFVHGEQILRK